MSNFFVCKKGEPSKVLAMGHGEPGKYKFNPAIFEEVEGFPPEGFEMCEPVSFESIMATKRDEMREMYASLPVEGRAIFADPMAKITLALDMKDFELAKYIAENIDVTAATDSKIKKQAEAARKGCVAAVEALMVAVDAQY